LKMAIKIARRHAEILQCQYLIASTYNRYYGIVFSTDIVDLNAKIEPYPHQYMMGMLDGELVACVGLYIRDTYVTEFGNVSRSDIDRLLQGAGVAERYHGWELRELTKLVVSENWEKRGVARFFIACCHNESFLSAGSTRPWLLTTCATESIFSRLHDRIGIRTRIIKPFPYYRVHELYRSDDDPMESRLIIPELDIPPRWRRIDVPGTHEIECIGGKR
jgi:hypothetical protein